MEHVDAVTPVETIAKRVREARNRKGMTALELADDLKRRGLDWDRQTVTKLETGRRQNVSVAELLALARALDVSPLHLLVPLEEVEYKVTPEESMPAARVREWVRGKEPLPGTDQRIFRSEVPLDELQAPVRGRLTVEGQSVRDAMRAEYRTATGKEISDDALLNWMTGFERPKELGDGEGA
ncbi:helix-turn-helix transcriptional regulator [Streptomyces sp. NPDC020766]|uniref:helix-turn-helix transcriptional regulator n=1 Tax=Streptomyces sp. NPDC020766 TaxID=3155011 RepID=UPI0033F29BD2